MMRARPGPRPRHWPLLAPVTLALAVSITTGQRTESGPQASPASLVFLSVGDWGKRTKEGLEAVARAMAATRAKDNASFVILGGDNFYENGVAGVDDPLWKSTYTEMFPEKKFPVPFYAVRGNHDYHDSPEAEIHYFEKHGDAGRYIMPRPGYYSITKQLADGTTADLIFLDTVTLAPRAAESVVRLPRNVQEVKRQQYAWLEATLQASVGRRSGWRIVVGHYPVFSVGEHGDTAELVAELLPVLERYAVDAYICGHDHTMQHLQDAGSGLQFMVNGNGAKMGSLTNRTGASTIRAAHVYYGFMAHELSKDRLTTRALDAEGREQYFFSQAPRGLATVKQDAAAGQDPAARQRGYASATKGAPAGVLPLTVVGGMLILVGLVLAVWRARRRSGGAAPAGGGRTRAQRYHSVFGSAFGGTASAAAASAATVGRSVWDDDLGEEEDLEEQVVELSHMA